MDREQTPETPTARDTLLHVADLHFWRGTFNPLRLLNKRALGNYNVWLRRRRQFAMHNAKPFVDALEAAGPRSILFTGDFTSTALDEEFALAREFVDVVRDRGFNVYALPGNHDVYTFEAARARRFERYFADYLPEEGYPALRRLPGGTPLILVPTTCPNLISSCGRINRAQAERVAALLSEVDGPAIVAGHYPILRATAAYTLSRERRLRNAPLLHAALGSADKEILYIAGHVHRFSYTRDIDFPHLTHLCTGAFFARNRREQIEGEFSEVRVADDGVHVLRHTCTGRWTTAPIA